MTVHACAVRSILTGCKVTSRPRDRFSRYSKWTDTFRTTLVYTCPNEMFTNLNNHNIWYRPHNVTQWIQQYSIEVCFCLLLWIYLLVLFIYFRLLLCYKINKMAFSFRIYQTTRRKVNFQYKDKAIQLQNWTVPEGSRRLRLPDFKTIGTWKS